MAPQEDDDKSDSLEGGKDDDEDSDKRGVQLPSSASVPLFEARTEGPADLGGSEPDLLRVDISQDGLHLAQSYAGKYHEKKNGEPGPGQHKVYCQCPLETGDQIDVSGSLHEH